MLVFRCLQPVCSFGCAARQNQGGRHNQGIGGISIFSGIAFGVAPEWITNGRYSKQNSNPSYNPTHSWIFEGRIPQKNLPPRQVQMQLQEFQEAGLKRHSQNHPKFMLDQNCHHHDCQKLCQNPSNFNLGNCGDEQQCPAERPWRQLSRLWPSLGKSRTALRDVGVHNHYKAWPRDESISYARCQLLPEKVSLDMTSCRRIDAAKLQLLSCMMHHLNDKTCNSRDSPRPCCLRQMCTSRWANLMRWA